MPHDTRTELRLKGSKDEAIDAILAALPKDAVVRDEDDGVGRFAGERTLVILSPDRQQLSMFRGSWGAIKVRLEQPQLKVVLASAADGVRVELTREPDKPPGLGSRITDLLSQMITVAAIVVAYHWLRSIPVDYPKVTIVAVVGAIAWSLIAHFVPKPQDRGLEGMVRDALTPLIVRARKEEPANSSQASQS